MSSNFQYGHVEDPSIDAVWGRITSLTVIVCACLHALFGVFSIWKLVFRNIKALFIPLYFFCAGAAYTFFTTSLLSFAIAVTHYSLDVGMTATQLVIYVITLVMISIFFSSGRTAGSLYAM